VTQFIGRELNGAPGKTLARGYDAALETEETKETESAFRPVDLEPSVSLLEAHFATERGLAPAPIRNYHRESPVSEAVKATATPAAVLIPIVLYPERLHVLFTRRHEDISYPGQICFPGGRSDPKDLDAIATALREAHEEIDLPPEQVQVLGSLGHYYTQSGFCITPVVGLVTPPFELTPSPGEVVEILEAPLASLTQADSYRIWRTDKERGEAFYALEHGNFRLNGPTVCLAMGFYEALAETYHAMQR
jgi:8-oxo-dGTP pyrophosphatase MutT (NUDIX family)